MKQNSKVQNNDGADKGLSHQEHAAIGETLSDMMRALIVLDAIEKGYSPEDIGIVKDTKNNVPALGLPFTFHLDSKKTDDGDVIISLRTEVNGGIADAQYAYLCKLKPFLDRVGTGVYYTLEEHANFDGQKTTIPYGFTTELLYKPAQWNLSFFLKHLEFDLPYTTMTAIDRADSDALVFYQLLHQTLPGSMKTARKEEHPGVFCLHEDAKSNSVFDDKGLFTRYHKAQKLIREFRANIGSVTEGLAPHRRYGFEKALLTQLEKAIGHSDEKTFVLPISGRVLKPKMGS